MLTGKKILIGITAGIAAYKTIFLVRLLIKQGADVKVILTPAAKEFVSPVVLSVLSKNDVLSDLFKNDSWSNHVELGRWADVMIIAPLSCNTLAKMANGICDNLLLAVYLSATCPVVVAPAMDADMWQHPSTKKNLALIKEYGNFIIDVENGELASGLVGEGRMAEPETILYFLYERFFRQTVLKNHKALVTAGPTYEPLDPVRFIGNHSSGKMGIALAEALYEMGADVTLICGPIHQTKKYKGIQVIDVSTAAEMYSACMQLNDETDIKIMAAAVADYKPAAASSTKIKKDKAGLTIDLVKINDILAALGATKKQDDYVVGFALETDNEREHAKQKLVNKQVDMIVLNSMKDASAGFGFDTNKVSVFTADGSTFELELAGKKVIADQIIQIIIQKINA